MDILAKLNAVKRQRNALKMIHSLLWQEQQVQEDRRHRPLQFYGTNANSNISVTGTDCKNDSERQPLDLNMMQKLQKALLESKATMMKIQHEIDQYSQREIIWMQLDTLQHARRTSEQFEEIRLWMDDISQRLRETNELQETLPRSNESTAETQQQNTEQHLSFQLAELQRVTLEHGRTTSEQFQELQTRLGRMEEKLDKMQETLLRMEQFSHEQWQEDDSIGRITHADDLDPTDVEEDNMQ